MISKNLLACALLLLLPGVALAADLGARHGGLKDDPLSVETSIAAPVSPMWSGLYIYGGAGASSTDYSAHGQVDRSTATTFNNNVYSYKDANGKTVYTTDKVYTYTTPAVPATGIAPAVPVVTHYYVNDNTCGGNAGCSLSAPAPANGDKVGVTPANTAIISALPSVVNYAADPSLFLQSSGSSSGFVGALGLGYDFKLGNSLLVGPRLDYQFRSASTTIGGVDVKQSGAFFLGGRIGFLPTHSMMLYIPVGYSWLNHSGLADNLRAQDPMLGKTGYSATYDDGSLSGPTLGAGLEFAIPGMKNMFAGVEWRHTWLGDKNIYSAVYSGPNADSSAYVKNTGNIKVSTDDDIVMGTLTFKLTGQ